MKACNKCGLAQPDDQFVWFDGLLTGEAKRCLTCRTDPTPPRKLPPWVPDPRFNVRRHALARFHERVRPDIAHHNECLFKMISLMATAPHVIDPPSWYQVGKPYEGHNSFHRGYLIISVDTLFTLSYYDKHDLTMVSTVLTNYPSALPADYQVPQWVSDVHLSRERRILKNEARRARLRSGVPRI